LDLILLHGLSDFVRGEEFGERLRDMLVVGEADLLVEEVALEDGVGASVEDFDEDGGDHVSKDEDHEEGSVRGAHLDHSVHDEETGKGGHDCDEELGNEHEASSDALDEAELGSVLQDEDEGVDGRRAEVLAGESTVDVGIAVDVADKALEASEAAADTSNEALSAAIVACTGSLHLLGNVLKNKADDPDDGANKRAKSKGATMVADTPPHADRDVRVTSDTIIIRDRLVRVVPSDASDDDDKLVHGHDESNNP